MKNDVVMWETKKEAERKWNKSSEGIKTNNIEYYMHDYEGFSRLFMIAVPFRCKLIIKLDSEHMLWKDTRVKTVEYSHGKKEYAHETQKEFSVIFGKRQQRRR